MTTIDDTCPGCGVRWGHPDPPLEDEPSPEGACGTRAAGARGRGHADVRQPLGVEADRAGDDHLALHPAGRAVPRGLGGGRLSGDAATEVLVTAEG